jgi:cytochrome P450
MHDMIPSITSKLLAVCFEILIEQREVIKVKGGRDGKITWNEIQMMKYSWRVAQEVMRFYPPIFGNFRQITKDIEFDGFDIPKGWQVITLLVFYLLHQSLTCVFFKSQSH